MCRYKMRFFSALALGLIFLACSTQQNTAVSRGYHAMVSKYNILYNGQLAYDKGIEELNQKHTDDFYQILSVDKIQPNEVAEITNTTKNPNFHKAEEKAIKAAQEHSIFVNGQEHNPQIDQAYLLLGKARYQDIRYIPAKEAFDYIIMKYPNSDIYNDAIVWAEKTNIRMKYNSLAIKNLKSLLRNATNIATQTQADAHATIAQGYINNENLDSAKVQLSKALELTKNTDEKIRYTYILGQLSNRLGQNTQAIEHFEKVINFGNSAPRIFTINAYAEKFANQDPTTIDTVAFFKEYKTLLRDRDNRPYHDIIFHQMGRLYDQYGHYKQAVKEYNRSLRKMKENNTNLKVANYKGIADIYYKQKQFLKASAYYDSTMVLMNPNTRSYLEVKRRRNSLIDIAKYEKVVAENDSIIRLAKMSDAEKMAFAKNIIETKKKLAQYQNARNEINSANANLVIGQASNFYFYSANSLQIGKQTFVSRWGNRAWGDNWRWRNEVGDAIDEPTTPPVTAQQQPKEDNQNDQAEIDNLLSQIPTGEEKIRFLEKDRENAYYQLGLLYSDLLEEYPIAIDKLETLLSFPPHYEFIEPAKYHLYKIYLKINPEKAKELADEFLQHYPNSTYTQIIHNPNAKIEVSNSPISDYENIYQDYHAGAYDKALEKLEQKIPTITSTRLLAKFHLLKATIVGKLEGITQYEQALSFVANTYPNSEEGISAKNILNNHLSQLKNLSFSMNLSGNIKMVYEVPYPYTPQGEELKAKLLAYAADQAHRNIKLTEDLYSKDKMFLVIHGVKSGNLAKSAQIYLELSKDYNINQQPVLINAKDYGIVLIKKNWEEYLSGKNKQ